VRTVWIRADTGPDRESRKRTVTSALENDLRSIVVLEEDQETFSRLGRFDRIAIEGETVRIGERTGSFVSIRDASGQARASELAGVVDFVVVDVQDWKVIPLENLVALFQNSSTDLFACVRTAEEARLFFGALESGVDGVLLDPSGPSEIAKLRSLLDCADTEGQDLVPARIVEVRPIGMGDRVCIDTCSMLSIGEGMLIGSQSNGLFLVHSESMGSEYVAARPFRVNAGSVQSYILTPGDRTPYLSDLKVGDEVLAVDRSGKARTVIIGRLKIERRPLIMVGAESGGRVFEIMLQNAETVRLVSGESQVSVVDLRPGDEVLLRIDEGGRHFGTKVRESIMER